MNEELGRIVVRVLQWRITFCWLLSPDMIAVNFLLAINMKRRMILSSYLHLNQLALLAGTTVNLVSMMSQILTLTLPCEVQHEGNENRKLSGAQCYTPWWLLFLVLVLFVDCNQKWTHRLSRSRWQSKIARQIRLSSSQNGLDRYLVPDSCVSIGSSSRADEEVSELPIIIGVLLFFHKFRRPSHFCPVFKSNPHSPSSCLVH